jgi:hypothetical protein
MLLPSLSGSGRLVGLIKISRQSSAGFDFAADLP